MSPTRPRTRKRSPSPRTREQSADVRQAGGGGDRRQPPWPPEPSEDQLALWEDFHNCEELGRTIWHARAVTHALHCMVYYHEHEGGSEVPKELTYLWDLGMQVFDEAQRLASEVEKAFRKWGNRALERPSTKAPLHEEEL